MLTDFYLLDNTIQEYSWGSYIDIPKLLGQNYPSSKPQAELWMGAHPNGPSHLINNNIKTSLIELTDKYPAQILGNDVAKKYCNKLPFLFKVLAAGKPLSIQAHPDLLQAKDGYERENKLGLAINASNRNYKDANHKPEIICALSPFIALKGFRKTDEIIQRVKIFTFDTLDKEIKCLENNNNPDGLKSFFQSIMTLPQIKKIEVINASLDYSSSHYKNSELDLEWIIKLNKEYPGDIGVISPIFLNIIKLNPGEALYLDAGELHAYLQGLGIELMANSDNVLRGGLTNKYIDVAELINTLKFIQSDYKPLTPAAISDKELTYPTPSNEFVLSKITIKKDSPFVSSKKRNIEILIVFEGTCKIESVNNSIELKQGNSVLIPAVTADYKITGEAILYKATVP